VRLALCSVAHDSAPRTRWAIVRIVSSPIHTRSRFSSQSTLFSRWTLVFPVFTIESSRCLESLSPTEDGHWPCKVPVLYCTACLQHPISSSPRYAVLVHHVT
jgi:hypothetical protein